MTVVSGGGDLVELSEESVEYGSVGRDGEDEGDDVDQREDQQEVDLSHFLSVNLFLRIKPEIFRAKIIIFILRIKDISTGWT